MTLRRVIFPLLLLALASATPAHSDDSGDPSRGKIRSKAEQCQECHGEAGEGTAEHYPKLAGQRAVYLRKQLSDFQSGARKNEIMSAMAPSLTQQDIADVVAYFSSAPHWSGEEANFDSLGQTLFRDGDSARGLLACAACHGDKGGGSGDASAPVPAIAGQRESYLANQLRAWKVGERRNSPGDVMNEIAQKLSDSEIDALAKFLSGPRAMQ